MNTGMLAQWITAMITGKNLMVWPLLVLSFLVLSLGFDLYRKLRRDIKNSREFIEEYIDLFKLEDREKLLSLCACGNHLIAAAGLILVQNAYRGWHFIQRSVEQKKKEYFRELRRKLLPIATLTQLGPIFGFLGTIYSGANIYWQLPNLPIEGINQLVGTAFLTTAYGLLLFLFGILALSYLAEEIAELEAEFDQHYRIIEGMIFTHRGGQNERSHAQAA